MIIKTKKYQLPKNIYIKLGLKSVLVELWWVWIVPLVLMLIPVFVEGAFWWTFIPTLLIIGLYWLFWYVQFMGVTQLEQYKMMFEKFTYEIDSRQILMKINAQQGTTLKWEMIKKAEKTKDAFLFTLSRAQFIYLPFDIFKSDLEMKHLEAILRRKNLLPQDGKEVAEKEETVKK